MNCNMKKSTLSSALLFLFSMSIANATSLLDTLDIDSNQKLSDRLNELIQPILSYDQNVVEVRVLDDIKLFDGNDYAFSGHPYAGSLNDDSNIYKWLSAKNDEYLVQLNIQVTIDDNYLNIIKSSLEELSDIAEPLDGSSNSRGEYPDPYGVKFYVGSIKGEPRKNVYLNQVDGSENILDTHYSLGMTNNIRSPIMGGDGLWVKDPFKFYGFKKSQDNGRLCENFLERIVTYIQPNSVVDHWNGKLKPAHAPYWSIVYPHIQISFNDANGKAVYEDHLFYDAGIFRTASISGFGSSNGGGNDSYNSIVSIDPINGWHPQDIEITSNGPKPLPRRFSQLTNSVMIAIARGNCRFGITSQTNFSVITKVNKETLGLTKQITADMHYETLNHIPKLIN